MKVSGRIGRRDWKLFSRDQETGKEVLIGWGNPDDIHVVMHQLSKSGHDVWTIAPDGLKTVPN